MKKASIALLVLWYILIFIISVSNAQDDKGRNLTLSQKDKVEIEGLSKTKSDCCWIEYVGLSTKKSQDSSKAVPTFILYHKREGFDDKELIVSRLSGNVGEVLGGSWSRKLLKKGQILSSTKYDALGRPVKTTHEPIKTVLISVKFKVINTSDSIATVLVLPDSRIESQK